MPRASELAQHLPRVPGSRLRDGHPGKVVFDATVRDLRERIRPRVVAPGHCTGSRAKAALAHAFAPERYGPSIVGSLYTLRAS